MLDDLVKKGLNAGYGEIVAAFVVFLTSIVGYYVLRHIQRYDKVHDAVFGEEGLHNSVSVIHERLDSQDEKIEQVIDSHETLVRDVIKIRSDTAFIRGWIERGEADKNRRRTDEV